MLANSDVDAKGADPDERRLSDCVEDDPPRRLWLSSFEMDRYEVTIAEYQRCIAAHACTRRPNHMGVHGPDPDPANYPAEVTFTDASAYCGWRSKRLPTDAEWEKAGRGTDDRMYPWGDAPPTCQHVSASDDKHDGFTLECNADPIRPPGARHAGASPYGVEDLEDNVAEWVSDWNSRPAHADTAMPEKFYSRAGNVLQYDWNARSYIWLDPRLVDPQGPPAPSTDADASHHRVKGGYMHPGISGTSYAEGDKSEPSVRYAGFRCARQIVGPTPPTVPSTKAGEPTLPFREPGYVPPGAATR